MRALAIILIVAIVPCSFQPAVAQSICNCYQQPCRCPQGVHQRITDGVQLPTEASSAPVLREADSYSLNSPQPTPQLNNSQPTTQLNNSQPTTQLNNSQPTPQLDNLQEPIAQNIRDSFAGVAESFAAAPRSFAPNMIGDFSQSSTTASIAVDRLGIAIGELDGYSITDLSTAVQFFSPDTTYTILSGNVDSLSNLLVAGGNFPPPGTIIVVQPTQSAGGVTIALSLAQINGLAPSSPVLMPLSAISPNLVSAVNSAFQARNGSVGNTVFNSGSFSYQVPENPPVDGSDDGDAVAIFSYVTNIVLPSPGAGATVGRVRLSENNSPMPQDRVFFDYNYFNGVPLTSSGVDVNRFTPGFEKTFFDRMTSIQMRIPMATTLNSNIVSDGPNDLSHAEFGDISFAFKALLHQSQTIAISTGLGVSVPTADDLTVNLSNGTRLLAVSNSSVHLTPYMAMLYTPTAASFFQSFLQVDVDANGSPVAIDSLNGSGLTNIGRWTDQSLLIADVGAGRWVYRNPDTKLSGVALTSELHYTKSLNSADSVTSGPFIIGNPKSNIELLNATVGAHARVGMTTFTAGYSAPLTPSDRVFNGELRLFVNRNF